MSLHWKEGEKTYEAATTDQLDGYLTSEKIEEDIETSLEDLKKFANIEDFKFDGNTLKWTDDRSVKVDIELIISPFDNQTYLGVKYVYKY